MENNKSASSTNKSFSFANIMTRIKNKDYNLKTECKLGKTLTKIGAIILTIICTLALVLLIILSLLEPEDILSYVIVEETSGTWITLVVFSLLMAIGGIISSKYIKNYALVGGAIGFVMALIALITLSCYAAGINDLMKFVKFVESESSYYEGTSNIFGTFFTIQQIIIFSAWAIFCLGTGIAIYSGIRGVNNIPKLCKNCGKELKKGAKFCVGCGSVIEDSPQDAPLDELDNFNYI